MKINFRCALFIVAVGSLFIIGCKSLGSQEMVYLGEETPIKNVVGKSTFIDFYGLGVSADKFNNGYNDAVKEMFKLSPKNTSEINNIKAFREYNHLPQVLGAIAFLTGYATMVNNPSGASLFLTSVGTIMWGVNINSLVLIGEPVIVE